MDEDNDRYLVHYHQPGWSYDCVATLPTLESAQRFQVGLNEEGIPSRLEILPYTLVNKLIGDGNWHALVQEWEPERYSILLTYFPTNARINLSGLADFPLVLQVIELATPTISDMPPYRGYNGYKVKLCNAKPLTSLRLVGCVTRRSKCLSTG